MRTRDTNPATTNLALKIQTTLEALPNCQVLRWHTGSSSRIGAWSPTFFGTPLVTIYIGRGYIREVFSQLELAPQILKLLRDLKAPFTESVTAAINHWKPGHALISSGIVNHPGAPTERRTP